MNKYNEKAISALKDAFLYLECNRNCKKCDFSVLDEHFNWKCPIQYTITMFNKIERSHLYE